MKIRRLLIALAVAIFAVRFALGFMGGADATGFLAGNVTNEIDLVIGATYVLFHLASVIVVPILILGTAIDWALARPHSVNRAGHRASCG